MVQSSLQNIFLLSIDITEYHCEALFNQGDFVRDVLVERVHWTQHPRFRDLTRARKM